MSGKETDHLLLQECLNPRAETVNISHVYIGRNRNVKEKKSETQPNTGILDNLKCFPYFRKLALQRKIKRALKEQYIEITLPSLPWLETSNISIEKYTTLQLESENEWQKSKTIELKNLFDKINESKRKRILIESQPGFGKTTLAHKIVSDWSRGSEYVKHFKFAILIILREYVASTLKHELEDVIGVENHNDVDFWSIINTEKTLLIFDGLDEISGRLRRDVLEILHDNKEKYKMTIVTTCRIGLSELERGDVNSMYRGVSRNNNIWSKKITILGITSEDNQSEFIEKFVDENDKRILMPRLAEIIAKRRKMFNSPLLLILLVYVTSENHDVEIETDTDLYKLLVDCIIIRSVAKKNSEISSVDFTVFTSHYNKPIFDEYKKIFVRFGEVCLNHILTDDLQFGSDTENEAIHQLGFLLKHVTKNIFQPIVRYEGFHLSILEFAAAVYMAHYFATNDKFRPEDIDRLFKIIYNKKMALPFLCDLLGIGIFHLIKELSRYYVFFWFNGEIVEYLFRKCLLNNVGVEHFVKIIPPYFTANSLWLRSATNDQNLAKFVVVELDDVRNLSEIPRPTHLKGLVCNGIDSKFEDIENVLKIAQNITSESLSFTIDLSYENMANSLKIFRRFSSDCKNLYFCNRNINWHSDFEECLTNGILAGLMLNNVIIESGNIDMRVIAKLIEYNHIESLSLYDMSPQSTKNLAATIRYLATTTINSLFVLFLGQGFCLGWNDFTKNGEKYSKETNNANMNLEDSASLPYSNSLEYNARVLFPLKPSRLRCSCCKFQSLRYSENWDMIVELTLTSITGSNQTYRPEFFKFKSLKILTLIICYEIKLDEASVRNIVESIKSLNLARLTIKWFASRHYFYGSLINGIRELLQNKEIFCSESVRFEFTVSELRPELIDFETIKSALLSDSKIVFCIASKKWSLLRIIVRNHVNDLLFFNIKYSYTLNTLDTNPFDIKFDGFSYTSDRHMLELTLG